MAKNYKTLELDPKYVPKKTEKYMSVEQRAYFYKLLMDEKAELLASMTDTASVIDVAEGADCGDEGDTSATEQNLSIQMRTNERAGQQMKKIDFALQRLESGDYGYSVLSGDEIGLKRLMARPVATLTIEEKDEAEKKER
jgi:DnaK suppressor protein